MKAKTLETFFKAGNALLKEKFKGDDSAIIIITTGGKRTHAIKGKSEEVGFALCELAMEDDKLFSVIKASIEFIEKEKGGEQL